MAARLNRRRYREVVATLKELIADKKAPAARRLRAVETLMEVYRRHDATEAAKETRRRATETGSTPLTSTAPDATAPAGTGLSAEEEARQFLEGLRAKRENSVNVE
jgi:hypothetical protein